MKRRSWYKIADQQDERSALFVQFTKRLEQQKEYKATQRTIKRLAKTLDDQPNFAEYDTALRDLSILRDAVHYDLGVEHGFSLRVLTEATRHRQPEPELIAQAMALAEALDVVVTATREGSRKKKGGMR